MTNNKLIDKLDNDNIPVFSVSEITKEITDLLEDKYSYVKIKGEISGETGKKYPEIYFSLKDSDNVISAIIKRNKVPFIKLLPKDGLEVICTGKITAYTRRDSKFQIDVDSISVEGEGQLLKIKEELRKKLEKEGLFDSKHKKNIPLIPNIIGIITSSSGSVIEDMERIIFERFPRRVLLYPIAVQGAKAVEQIRESIKYFNKQNNLNKPDVIIIARGGGSIEDLWCFNDETIVRSIFESNIPIISAIGHEPDVNLIDYIADISAATPSHAAKLVVPERKQLISYLDKELAQFNKNIELLFKSKKQSVLSAFISIPKTGINLSFKNEIFVKTRKKFYNSFLKFFQLLDDKLHYIISKFNIGSHVNTLKRGYTFVRNINKKSFVKLSKDVEPNKDISITFYDGTIEATTKKKNN
tara:strand:+ start:50 stop:1288 length:1239 start_codon:yes stop_codon:yes gene_type:complete